MKIIYNLKLFRWEVYTKKDNRFMYYCKYRHEAINYVMDHIDKCDIKSLLRNSKDKVEI